MFRRMNQYSMIARAALLCASIWCSPSLFAQGLQLSFNIQAPTCFGYTNGTASAVVSGGSGQYGFAWSNAQSGQTNFGLGAGTYTVTVTDQVGGATVVGNAQVVQPTAVQATIVPSGINCNSNTGTLTVSASGGTGAISFNWSNTSTATSIPVNAPGNYFVTATDANGCAAVANSTVLAPITINMVVNNAPCSYLPNGGSIGAGVSGGQGPHQYRWSNGNTNAVILSQPAGTYTVTVTDARSCTAVSTATLTVPTPIVVTIVSTTPACSGNNGSSTVSATGGTPPYRYVWGNGTQGPTATGLAPGIYYVCTFDANNCQLDTWITIEAANGLNLSLVPTHADCNANNGTAAVTVTPANATYTYAWNVPNIPNTATSVSGIASGTQVAVTVTDVNTGCQGVASTTINTQNTLALNVNKTDIPCSGTNTGSAEGLVTGGTGPITFAWTYPDSTSFSGQQITGLAQGTYHLIATDSKGCKATATANILVLADVNLQVDKSVVATCEGEATLSATAAANATLTWFDANGNQLGTGNTVNVPAGTGTTTYKVVASDGSNCTAEKTVTVEPGTLDISLDINNPSFACSEVPVTWAVLNNGNVPNVSYAWSAPTGVIVTPANSATPSINAPKGSYEITVTATTPQGCSATMTGTLRVSEQPEISVDNNEITSCSTLVTIKAIVTGTADIRWYEAGTNNQIGTGPNVTVPAGVYTVVAGVTSGCTDTENLNVIVRSADVNLAANNTAQACESASLNWAVANLDPNDQLTYQWSAPAGVSVSPSNAANTTVTANMPGVYAVSVTATNQHGCSTTLSAPLNVRAKPTVNADKQEINACEAQTLLTVTATNAPQLVWTNAAGVPVGMGDSITVSAGSVPAIYTVTASNGADCSATAHVTVNPNPVDVAFAVNNPNALCGSNSANWTTLNNDPKDNLTFQWTAPTGVVVSPDNGANPNVSANAPGNYSITVTATNQFGCSATLTAPLRVNEQPTVSVSQPEIKACEAQTILSATATGTAQIVWVNAAGTQVGTGASITVPSGTASAVYTVIAGNNICADSAQVLVTPRATDVSFGVNNINTLCNSNTANWTTINNHPADNLTYQWNAPAGVTVSPNNAANPQISATATGTYTVSVTATNQHGCSTTLTAPLTINEQPTVAVAQNEIKACEAQTILSATATGTAQVVWVNAAGAQVGTGTAITVPSGTVPAVYTVIAGNNFCVDSAQVTVIPRATDVSFGVNNINRFCDSDTVSWTTINNHPADNLTYQWSAPTGVAIVPNNAANPQVAATAPGNYTITVTATNQHGCSETLTAPLTVNEIPSLKVDKKEQTACGPQATLSAIITGASQVVWTNAAGSTVGNGASIVVPSGTGPVVYTVTASNGVGCSVSESIRLTPNPVDISFGGNNQAALCETNTANWATINNDSKDTLTYKWDAPTGVTVTPKDAANPTVTAILAGNYIITVTATNQYGCTSTLTAPVLVEAQQSLSGLIKPDLCDGRSVKFENLTILSGMWDFGDGNQTAGVDVSHIYAVAGTYVVRFVPNDKCAKPFDTVINVAATQTVVAGIANTLQNCVGQATFQFTGQGTSPNPIQSWAWTFQPGSQTSTQQNPSISFNTEGEVTATLIVRDVKGCADTIRARVRADIVDEAIAAHQNFCPGNSVALNPDFNSTYTYNWTASPADPTLDPKDPNPKVSPELPTTYTLEVEKGACKAVFSTQVEPLPTVALSVPERQSTCDGSPVIVPATGTAGTTFTWSTSPNFNPIAAVGDTLKVSSPVGETRYYVRAEKNGECPKIDSTLVINGKVDIEAIGPNPTVCKDTDTELQVRNMDPLDQLNYAWSNGLPNVFNPTVAPASNSTYTVTVTNQAGCTAALTFAVTVIDVRVTAEVIGKDTICFGEKAQLQANATGGNNFKYAWEPAATLNNSTIPNPMAGPEETTLYTVTVTDDHLCTATANVQVFFVANQCVEPYIFVPKAFTPNGDQNNDFFRVRGNNITELYMVVWNRWGEKVFETNDIDSMGWDGSYKGKEGTPDSYAWLVRARCGNGTMWTKKGDVTLLK